jgi:hypothetical protein
LDEIHDRRLLACLSLRLVPAFFPDAEEETSGAFFRTEFLRVAAHGAFLAHHAEALQALYQPERFGNLTALETDGHYSHKVYQTARNRLELFQKGQRPAEND